MITKIKENLYTLGKKVMISKGVGRWSIMLIYILTSFIPNDWLRISLLIIEGIAILLFDAIKAVSEPPKDLAMRCKLRYLLLSNSDCLSDFVLCIWVGFLYVVLKDIIGVWQILGTAVALGVVLAIVSSVISLWANAKIQKEAKKLIDEEDINRLI